MVDENDSSDTAEVVKDKKVKVTFVMAGGAKITQTIKILDNCIKPKKLIKGLNIGSLITSLDFGKKGGVVIDSDDDSVVGHVVAQTCEDLDFLDFQKA